MTDIAEWLTEPNAHLLLSWVAVNCDTQEERDYGARIIVAALKAARRQGARDNALALAALLDTAAKACRAIADEGSADKPPEPEPEQRVCPRCHQAVYSAPGKHVCGVTEYPAEDHER